MREKLLDPTGVSERRVDTTLAPRLRSLGGLTAGLLENGKPNASVLLTETGRALRAHGIGDRLVGRKPRPSGRGKPGPLPVPAADVAFRVLNSPGAVLVVVAGAGNAGVSAVVETFGPRGGPPPVVRVQP